MLIPDCIPSVSDNCFQRAQLKMGTAYELCQLGCDFNPALSLHYNALAARQGEAEAEMAISKWFLCGHEGVFEKNEELAYEYAKRAAASGLGTAEFAIGRVTNNPAMVRLLTALKGTSTKLECTSMLTSRRLSGGTRGYVDALRVRSRQLTLA